MGETVRTDAWTKREDNYAAKTILHYIRTGKTQLEAFELVGERIARTASAVGFRWNSVLREEHQDEFKKAKQERLAQKRRNGTVVNDRILLSDVITVEQRIRVLVERNKWQEKEIQRLQQENNELEQHLQDLNEFVEIFQRMDELRRSTKKGATGP